MNHNTIFILIAIVTGECTMLYYKNTALLFVWFRLISIQLIIKVICIYPASTHIRRIKAPFNINHFVSYRDHRRPRRYQGSANHCEKDCNLDVICLIQQFLTIHYCNQSVLAIVPDLNIFVWSITIFISFRKVPCYITYLLSASYL